MRDILNLLDSVILDESVGLANRKPGTRFANPQGTEIIFHDLAFYPESGTYETPEQMQAAIGRVAQQIGVDPSALVWMNDPRGARAFGIAHFVDDANKD